MYFFCSMKVFGAVNLVLVLNLLKALISETLISSLVLSPHSPSQTSLFYPSLDECR